LLLVRRFLILVFRFLLIRRVRPGNLRGVRIIGLHAGGRGHAYEYIRRTKVRGGLCGVVYSACKLLRGDPQNRCVLKSAKLLVAMK